METKINMPERGDFNSAEVVDDDFEDEGTIEEVAEKLKKECEHVYSNTDNGFEFDKILSLAEQNYEKDKTEWSQLLTELENELTPVDDEDDIADILRKFKQKAIALS